MARSPRKTVDLSESVQQQLNMYVLAAGAAGVGMLALSQPVEAKIVYTPVHVTLHGQPYPLDLNHDGKIDFYLVVQQRSSFAGGDEGLSVCHAVRQTSQYFCSHSSTAPNALNGVRVQPVRSVLEADALFAGAKIQRGERFLDKKPVFMGGVNWYRFCCTTTTSRWSGPWVNGGKGVKKRYLGLKFRIKGKFHFGWARLAVTTAKAGFVSTLTGYAYETIPLDPIVAGQTKGTYTDLEMREEAMATPADEPVTLGALALGAPGLAIWRREESVIAAPKPN